MSSHSTPMSIHEDAASFKLNYIPSQYFIIPHFVYMPSNDREVSCVHH